MSTPWPIVALIALLGLAIGSFLNVVIYRVPRSESIAFPASHCPSCQTNLRPWHNIPVLSWLVLRGRCCYCNVRISARYPLVEAGTAALFAAITLRFGLSVELPAYLYLAAIGVTLAMIDFDARRLPDTIVLPSYAVAVLLLMPAGAANGDWTTAARAFGGMAAFASIYFVLALAYPNAMTFGDVKLAGLLGLYLGWISWSAILIGVFGGFLLASIGGTAVAVTPRGQHRAASFALAPCMLAAAGLALFVTMPLSGWYVSLLTSA
ncbi:MAG: prepilin peptidase [Jatrophihabitantaceae bacterium]